MYFCLFFGVLIIGVAKSRKTEEDTTSLPSLSGEISGTAPANFLTKQLREVKENSGKTSYLDYILGLTCILITSWIASIVVVVTRFLKDIHFSLIMFHYGWIASLTLFLWLIIEQVTNPSSLFQDINIIWRLTLTQYNTEQYFILAVVATLNAVGMNLSTLAFQQEKSSFIALVAYIGVVYAFITDVAIFNV